MAVQAANMPLPVGPVAQRVALWPRTFLFRDAGADLVDRVREEAR